MILAYKEEKGKPIIYIFYDRESNGIRKIKKITDFEPYFYVKYDEKIPNLKQIKKVVKGNYYSLFGDKLKKIIVNLPEEVPQIRDKFTKTYEADVLFLGRYMIDKMKEIKKERLRIQYTDIETDDCNDVTNTPLPITCIGVYDNFLNKYITFIWSGKVNKRVFKNENHSIYYFKSEIEMLKEYVKFITTTDPDILTGWYFVEFDLRYIINRMGKLGLNWGKLSPINIVGTREDILIKGRICMDMIQLYSNFHEGDLESRQLDDVGRDELKLEKLKFIGTPGKLWREDIVKLIKYNKRDVEIVKELDEKLRLIEYNDEKRRLAKCNFENVFTPSMLIDSYILSRCYGKIILPSRPKITMTEEFEGARLFSPSKGLHKNVAVIDLKSLYPSIILSMNMSPETLDKDGSIKVGNGISFTNKKVGLYPEILNDMFKFRDEKKKLMIEDSENKEVYDRQQITIKNLTNAFYGVLGLPKFRLFCPPIPSSITFIGRKILEWTKEYLERKDLKVVYGDTDSIFFEIKKDDNVEKLVNNLNIDYKEFVKQFSIDKHFFKMEYEKLYSKLILHTKKLYAGFKIYDRGRIMDNEFEVKGLGAKRSDNSRISRKIQKNILGMIMDEKSKDEIKNYVKDEINNIKSKFYDFEDLGIPKGINKNINEYKTTSPHIRGIIYSNKYFKTDFKLGSKPKLIYIKSVPKNLPLTNEICFTYNHQIPKDFVIDYDKIIEKTIYMKLDGLFETVGWSVEEMLGKGRNLMEF